MHSFLRAAVTAASLLSCAIVLAVPIVPQPIGNGEYSVGFQGSHTESGNFADRYEFDSPIRGFMSVTLDSAQPAGFVGVAFLGYGLSTGPGLVLLDSALSHVVIGPLPIPAGPEQFTIGFNAAPALNAGLPASTSYTGTITISPIPEPETWLLMGAGLLAVTQKQRRVIRGKVATLTA